VISHAPVVALLAFIGSSTFRWLYVFFGHAVLSALVGGRTLHFHWDSEALQFLVLV